MTNLPKNIKHPPDTVEHDESGRRSSESLAVTAYDRIEDLIVHRQLKPGSDVRMAELQKMIAIGRTPVYQAVRRFSAETLILIQPRNGLLISPVDLTRDRRLLTLRKDMDRFVVQLAAERLTSNQRNQMLTLARQMRERRDTMDLIEFNQYDRALDRSMLDAAAEPFLDRTLRPLHTIFRRIGGLHLSQIGGKTGLLDTIDWHLELIDAVIARDVVVATQTSNDLIGFADSMFDVLETEIDPALLDARYQTTNQ
jgi:DNA-binding GntR family transcriptional regulator